VRAGEFSLIYVTAEDLEEARTLAYAVVGEGLAACANVIPDITPVFRVNDEVAEEAGAGFLAMTRTDLVAQAVRFIEERHGAECPCILCVAVSGGNAAFLDWMRWETAEMAPRSLPERDGD